MKLDLWNVEVETDSKLLVDSLCSGNWPWYLDAAMLQVKDKLYTSRFSVCHIYREANSAADFIAKWASTTCSSEHLWSFRSDSKTIPFQAHNKLLSATESTNEINWFHAALCYLEFGKQSELLEWSALGTASQYFLLVFFPKLTKTLCALSATLVGAL